MTRRLILPFCLLLSFTSVAEEAVPVIDLRANQNQVSNSTSTEKVESAPKTSVHDLYLNATKHSPRLSVSQSQLHEAQALQKKARSFLFPSIDASAGLTRSDQKDVPSYNQESLSLSVSQYLFDWEKIERLDQGKLNSEIKRSNLNIEQENLILEVAEKWVAALIALEALKLSEIEITSYKKLRDRAIQSLSVGQGRKVDVAEASAAYGLAVATRIQRENADRIARQNLSNLTGVQTSELPPWDNYERRIKLNDLKLYAEQISDNKPIFQQQQAVEYAHSGVRALRGQYIPTLLLNLSYTQTEYTETKTSSDPLLLSLTANWNLFNGFGTSADLEGAYASVNLAKAQLRDVVQSERLKLLNTWSNLQTDEKKIPAIEIQLSASKIAFESYDQGYQIGTESLPNLLDAQRQYQSSQLDLINTIYNYWINYLTFKLIIGQLVVEDLPN